MRRYFIPVIVFASIYLCLFSGVAVGQVVVLDNDSIIQMTKWRIADSEIIAAIGRSQANFDLSATTITTLRSNLVSEAVLDAMFAAAKGAAKPSTTKTSAPSTSTGGSLQKSIVTADSPQRLAEAIRTVAKTLPICDASVSNSCTHAFHIPCPETNSHKDPTKTISLYFLSGTSDPSSVDDSGGTCFEIHDFNDILYTATFQVTETPPTGNAFDYLQDAIKTVTGLTFSSPTTNPPAAAAKTLVATKTSGDTTKKHECPPGLGPDVTTAQAAASRFAAALAAIDPGKDASGNINLVDWRTTTFKWQPIPAAYRDFEAAISRVLAGLSSDDVDVCNVDVREAAEAVVIDAYVPARSSYTLLASRVASDHTVRTTSQIHATSSYSIVVQANYPSGTVANGTKTFSLAAGRKILSTSGGFLITQVPSTSYSSVTAPTNAVPPGTQNVLAVNNPNGASLGLAALLHLYIPNIDRIQLNWHNWGFALSAGPTYNLSNGKADTSKVGLFAGVSLHVRNQLFLTPGINLAQYSSWPVGFTQAGQVIPPNTGTPVGVSRWTTRFAFTITYKIKDFGQLTNTVVAAPAAPANSPQTKPPK